MRTNVIRSLIILMSFISCQQIERDNPFDPECPKQIWTPTDFQAVLDGNSVKLTWNLPVTNISSVKVFKRINNSGDFAEICNQNKDLTQFIDSAIIGGKVHEYNLVAYAGSNESNKVTIEITPIIQATISTISPTQIGTKSVTLSGIIILDGGNHVTERGFCWNTISIPTVTNSKIIVGSGIGMFSSNIIGLEANTTYYARAYAINSIGVSYGNEVIFTTENFGTVTDIDGNIYKTVTIGSQIWMMENLKTTRYNDATAIPNITKGTTWNGLTTGAYCDYTNDENFRDTYGALYNWYAVNIGKLAPKGWHIPTDKEWTLLTEYLGGVTVAGGILKETGTVHWSIPNTDASNACGFFGLPGGNCDIWQNFYGIREYGYWWSSTKDGSTNAKYRYLIFTNGSIGGEGNGSASPFQSGFSVRCIKD